MPGRNRSNQAVWRSKAVAALYSEDMGREAIALSRCTDPNHWVGVHICEDHPEHYAKPIRRSCRLRACPICADKERSRLMSRYFGPVLKAAQAHWDGHSLKHIILTTPYNLTDPECKQHYAAASKAMKKTLDQLLFQVLNQTGKLSPDEKRRRRVSFKDHHIGLISTVEFGGEGLKLHFHLLLFGPFIPADLLSQTWNRYMPDAFVTKIEKVEGSDDIRRCLEYVTKPPHLRPEHVPQYLRVLKRSRRVQTRGIFYGLKKAHPSHPKQCPKCKAPLEIWTPKKYEQWERSRSHRY
jgi:hypothetical protein